MIFGRAKETDAPADKAPKELFPGDTFLRRKGFRIHSRGRNGNTWSKDGELYTESEARDIARMQPDDT